MPAGTSKYQSKLIVLGDETAYPELGHSGTVLVNNAIFMHIRLRINQLMISLI